ncbi:CHAT domain-containing tetratricopeptide repeat protein [Polymorphospora sp. NPDC051019]|uniref:CHAT domain-containing protein n=1 Tax=Polymorphospora sp. NPDC051019 TaxID=3155725 RepID=UPI00341E1128
MDLRQAWISLRDAQRDGDEATIARAAEALAELPDDVAERRMLAEILGYAAGALIKLGPGHLDAAVALADRAVRLDPDAELAMSLPLALALRSAATTRLADLDRSIAVAGRLSTDEAMFAVATTAMRAARGGSLDELDAAIDLGRRAAAGLRRGAPARQVRAVSLGDALFARFLRTGDRAAFVEAVRVVREATSARDHDIRAYAMLRLGEFYLAGPGLPRFMLLFQARQAERLSRPVRMVRARALHLLGQVQRLRGDHRRAVSAFAEAAGLADAEPVQRAVNARLWGDTAAEAGDHHEALAGYRAALDLLPWITSWRADRVDREHTLTAFVGLARDAAAVALQVGDPQAALVLLEQGRGLLLDQLMSPRARLDELERVAPRLAERLDDTIAAMNEPATVGEDLTGRARLVRELDDVSAAIRGLDGFARWDLPPLFADLEGAARDGPVVVVNVAASRCDALILTASGMTTLRLTELTLADATAQAERLPDADDDVLREILAWLWRTTVGPILGHRALRPLLDASAPPRLWWVPTGPLALLPLHAAGDALDLVVPSLAPTVTALLRSRAKSAPVAEARMAVVVVDQVPGLPTLTGARRDARMLADRATRLDGLATSGPQGYGVVHYACHATTDLGSPSESHLVLGPELRLSVTDLTRWHLRHAELAFLAACGTVRTSGALADEAVHIAGGFLTAGYAQVIATLWSVNDQLAHRVATHFYAGDPLDAARALHHAVRVIRRHPTYGEHPTAWAAYVHLGR